MPAAYAHYCFGQAVLTRLPPEKQASIQAHRSLFDIGLQGPDLLFNYRPLLFRSRDSEAMTVYLWGFLCHFALDWHCHSYIDAAAAAGGPGHLAMEADFDRALLAESGLPVCDRSIAGCIRPSWSNARMISGLFPGTSARQLHGAMTTMRLNQWFLSNQHPLVRGLVSTALKLSGCQETFGSMLLYSQPNPGCEESSRQLKERYIQAQDTAERLIEAFRDSARGLRDYDPLYQWNFNAVKEVIP